jgi:hypothetical protein
MPVVRPLISFLLLNSYFQVFVKPHIFLDFSSLLCYLFLRTTCKDKSGQKRLPIPQKQKMSNPNPNNRPPNPKISPEKYARLRAEAKAPYRGLRQFIYVAFGASGFIGAVIFLAEIAAGRNMETAIPNFALQIGVVALMVWLFRLEQKASNRSSKFK